VEVVKLLLADLRLDPTAYHNHAIRRASVQGHNEVVKLLKYPILYQPTKFSLRIINEISDLSNEERFRIMLSFVEDNKLDDSTTKLMTNSDFIQAYLATNEELADMLNNKQIPVISHLNHAAAAALYAGDIETFKNLTPLSSYAAYQKLVK
jgi:hypothetical protein